MLQEAANETKTWQREEQEKINTKLRDGIMKSKTSEVIQLSDAQVADRKSVV